MPTEDDGSRDDPLFSDRSWAVSGYRPNIDALTAAPTRVVIGVGEESRGHLHRTYLGDDGRTTRPAGDGVPEPPRGFTGDEFGYPGKPEAFARTLREVLDNASFRTTGLTGQPPATR
jgi:hypothetical protein